MILISYRVLSKARIASRLILFTLLSSFLLCLIPGPRLIAAKTDQTSSTGLNLLNIYGGASDVYFTVEDGSNKKTKASIKEYGLVLELEDRSEKWKVDISFSQWDDYQLNGENFSAKLSYLPFKTKKPGIFTCLQPYIGCAINYHYNKIDLPETNFDPNNCFNLYHQTIKGFGAGPRIGIKVKNLPFKGTVWHTELGGTIYTYKSSLIEEEFISGTSFTIDSHFKKRFYTIFLGLGYQFRRFDLDGRRFDPVNNEDIVNKYGKTYYPSSKFTQHLFYFNLSYPF